MKTALIIQQDSQQVILQAEGLQEQQILKMLLRPDASIRIHESIWKVDRDGDLFVDHAQAAFDAFVINVGPPVPPDPEVITMTKDEFRSIQNRLMRDPLMTHSDDWAEWLEESLDELRTAPRNPDL